MIAVVEFSRELFQTMTASGAQHKVCPAGRKLNGKFATNARARARHQRPFTLPWSHGTPNSPKKRNVMPGRHDLRLAQHHGNNEW